MKYLVIIFFLLLFLQNGKAQEEFKLKGKPKTLEESFLYLNKKLDYKEIDKIKNTSEDSLILYHFTLGMWIRNDLGLWKDSQLARYFVSKGVFHPDDMSSIIITSYHRYLNNQEINFQNQIIETQRFYENMKYINPPVHNQIPYYFSLGVGCGWGKYQNLNSLNDYLLKNNFPKIKSTYLPFMVDIALHKKRIFFNLSIFGNTGWSNDTTTNTNKSDIKMSGMEFDLMYDVIKRPRNSYFIIGGFSMCNANLKLESQVNDSINFQNLPKLTNSVTLNYSFITTANIGIGIKSNSENIIHWNIKTGYNFQFGEPDSWNINGKNLGKNPKINLGGFFINANLYLNISKLLINL